jgi:hypothetical protein
MASHDRCRYEPGVRLVKDCDFDVEPIENEKMDIFTRIEQRLKDEGFKLGGKDEGRPWGGFLLVDEPRPSNLQIVTSTVLTLKA